MILKRSSITMDNTNRQVAELAGLEEPKGMSYRETYLCALLGVTQNPCVHGCDAFDENGSTIEIKCTETSQFTISSNLTLASLANLKTYDFWVLTTWSDWTLHNGWLVTKEKMRPKLDEFEVSLKRYGPNGNGRPYSISDAKRNGTLIIRDGLLLDYEEIMKWYDNPLGLSA